MMGNPAAQPLSEEMAMRLYNSVVANDVPSPSILPLARNGEESVEGQKSVESLKSCNEFGDSCRICRWNRSDMQILQCPCHCKGSVGFIHLQCLRIWIMHRRDNHCEICKELFDLPDEEVNLKRMFHTFFTRCLGPIIKHLVYSASLIPLAHVILQQVLFCMESINQSSHEDLSIIEVFVASCALLTSSALFFHFFEFIATRFFLIRNILRQWWAFGNTNDFPLIELDSDIFQLL